MLGVRTQPALRRGVSYDELGCDGVATVTGSLEPDMTRPNKFLWLLFVLIALTPIFSNSAAAGALDEAKAQAHLNAIAAADLDGLMRDYEDDAYMDWVGGTLDGRYQGRAAIQAVWQKFIAANAGKPRAAKFGKLEAYANPKGATITASAEYIGATQVKVWHALVYRDGSLATEIWQIAPALQLAP
jgi:ketosteroid isomerase-like protein